MTSFYEFFSELKSYSGVAGIMPAKDEFLSGIGKRALDSVPDIFNKFGDIRDILELRWKWVPEFAPYRHYSGAFTPYSYDKKNNVNSLFLPATQVDMPYLAVNGDVKQFGKSYGDEPVNMIIYKDVPSTPVSIGIYLRNNTMSPWVAVFVRAMEAIKTYGTQVQLVIPRYNRDVTDTAVFEFMVDVRIISFSVGNTMGSVTPAALALMPAQQGTLLLDQAGIK